MSENPQTVPEQSRPGAPERPSASSHAPGQPAPEQSGQAPSTRRHGRRARVLTDAEREAQEAAARTAAVPEASDSEARAVTEAPAAPAEKRAAPSVRRLGRRARVVEVDDPRSAGGDARLQRDADGVELGELTASDAPDPRPAPRFEGRVLDRAEHSGGSPLVWVIWALVALALVVVVVLLVTGVIGPGAHSALAASALNPAAPGAAPIPDIDLREALS